MRLTWSPLALGQLSEIRQYVAQDKPLAAERLAARIAAAVSGLERHPKLGRVGRVAGTRELAITGTPFIAAYAIFDDHIQILAVVHGARQWKVPKPKTGT